MVKLQNSRKNFSYIYRQNQYYTDQSQKQLLFASGNGIAIKFDSFIYNLGDNTAHYFTVIGSDTDDNGGVYMIAAANKYFGHEIRNDISFKTDNNAYGNRGYTVFHCIAQRYNPTAGR